MWFEKRFRSLQEVDLTFCQDTLPLCLVPIEFGKLDRVDPLHNVTPQCPGHSEAARHAPPCIYTCILTAARL